MIRILLFLLLFCLNSSCYAGTTLPDKNDKEYCEYSKIYPCVSKIHCELNKQVCSASAVIISPDWGLTAAHVVKDASNFRIEYKEKKIIINKVICHKDFKEEIFGKNDIALIHFEEKINLDFFPELYSENDEVGKECDISGFGIAGTFLTGARIFDNKQRAGTNLIDYIDKDLLVCTANKNKPTRLEFISAHGDSGGGLFINKKLAGINSCVMAVDKNPNSDFGDESGHTRISIHRLWIKERIENEIQSNGK